MLCVLIAVLALCACAAWARGVWAMRGEPPVLAGWLPLVGHGHMLLGDGVKMFQSVVRMSEECTKKGGLVTFHLGFKKVYGITDPDDSFTVLNTCLEKGLIIRFIKQFLGNGLFTADVDRWHTSRKLLNPAFSQKILDGFIDIFNSQAEKLIDMFASEVGKPFDHEKLLRMNNLETICCTSFDVENAAVSDILKQYLPLLTTGIKKINKRMQNFWLHSDFVYNMTGLKREINEIIKKLVVLSDMMIQKKILEKQNMPKQNSEIGRAKKFVDLVLEAAAQSGAFSPRQVREEADTVMAAGHDTTASTLTFALTLLGSHPRAQHALLCEILQVCGDSDKRLEKQDLSKLVYTEAVLKETLRLYPIGVILPRCVNHDLVLKNYTIKANSECIILAHGLHRHGVWGADADRFRPERWLDRAAPPDPRHFAAFGLGRRSCIGRAYALMSMKTVLAHVVRRYRVSSDVAGMVVSLHVMSRPESGHFILLQRR